MTTENNDSTFYSLQHIKLFLTGICMCCGLLLSAQSEKGSKLPEALAQEGMRSAANSYALVIGISQYEHFPSLNFADRDARAFNEFLQSKAGGGLDSSHIFLRTNNQAKAGDIWRGFSWLERRADSAGKTAYIYFSGHGDAASLEEAYLLAYDAPNEGDPNLYNTGGTFQIYNLKSKIKKMVAKGVNVILITDACRTNELPGKENGSRWTFQSIMEQRSGELQMTSCASNEQSLEDKRWGGGRGVFSYYLIAGLSGLADNDPEDGHITLYELQRYIKDNVRKETRSLTSGKPRQNPLFCCEEKNEEVLANVNEAWKQKMVAYMQQSSQQQLMASTVSASRGLSDGADSNYKKLLAAFSYSLEHNELLKPGRNAAVILDSLLQAPSISEREKEDLTDALISSLINEGQKIINRYTKPPVKDSSRSAINKEFFRNGSLYFEKAAQYCKNNTELWNELQSNQLFLEARSKAEEIDPEKLKSGIHAARKSIEMHPTGYNYQTLGLLYRRTNEFDSAYKYYFKAHEKNPDWTPVISGLRSLFKSSGKFYNPDSAQKYLQILAEKNQSPYSFWELGSAYFNTNKRDSGIYYFKKATELSRYSFDYLNQLISAYRMKKDSNSILSYIKELHRTDKSRFIQKEAAIGRCYEYISFINKTPHPIFLDSCFYWYRKSIKVDPKARIHKNMVSVFHEARQYDSMYNYAYQYYLVDTADLSGAGYVVSICQEQFSHTKDSAALYKIKPFLTQLKKRLPENYPGKDIYLALADLHSSCNELDSTLVYLKKGYSKDNFLLPLDRIVKIHFSKNELDSAQIYLTLMEQMARFYSNPIIVYNELTGIYFNSKKYTNAIANAKEGLKFNIGLHGIAENNKVNERNDLLQKLAACYYMTGNKDSSYYFLNELKKDTQAYHISLSAYYTNIGNLDSSLYHTLEYVAQYEHNSTENQYLQNSMYQKRLYHIAQIYYVKKEDDKAMEYFKKSVMHDLASSLNLFEMAKAQNDYSIDRITNRPEFIELEKLMRIRSKSASDH